MRILQVLPHLSKGGAERVVVELSNALIEANHEVTLLLSFPVDPNLNQKDLDRRIKVMFVSANFSNRIVAFLKLPFFVSRYWKAFKTYDIIHCHLTYGLMFGILVSFFRKITYTKRVRLIATCHMVGANNSKTTRIINEKTSYFFDIFALVAQDDKWRKFISTKKRTNFEFVVNGISAKLWMDNKLQRLNRRYAGKVGTISRLQVERKPWLFLDVFSQVNELSNYDVRFILGGDGKEMESLIALSEELNLSGVISMPGLVKNPSEILKDLDLYVALNVEEVTGIAGLEAVFSGIPTIAIQLSATYLRGEKDWIWSNQDTKIVARKIVTLLSNPIKLREMAEYQYSMAVREYSIERMRDRYLELYAR